MFEQSEIVLVPFPYSDLSGMKQRPALILSNKSINKNQDRICCLITSNPNNEGMLIEGKDFSEGKLPFKSWVKPQRLFTIDERAIRKKMCKINKNFHNKILKMINGYLQVE